MASTYTSRVRAERPATGEQSGTWGTTANQNIFDMFDEAIYSLGTIALSDADTTLTVPDGGTSPNRAFSLIFTGALTAQRTITLPDVVRRFEIENRTTGGFALLIKTATSGTVSIAAGETAVLYANGSSLLKRFTSVADTTKVDVAGDTMTGDLEVEKSNPQVILNKTAAAQEAALVGQNGGSLRWSIVLGSNAAEAGSNAGSHFVIGRYSDAGSYIANAFSIVRDTGVATFGAGVEIATGNRLSADGMTVTGGGTDGALFFQDVVLSNTGTGSFDVALRTFRNTTSGLRFMRMASGANYFEIRSDNLAYTSANFQSAGTVLAGEADVIGGAIRLREANNGSVTRFIHCNVESGEGRIGFLSTGGNWIARANDAGHWFCSSVRGGVADAGVLRTWGTANNLAFRWDGANLFYRIDEVVDRALMWGTNATNMAYASGTGGPTGISLNGYDYSGNLYGIYVDALSDERLKQDIEPSPIDALGRLRDLDVISFNWTPDAREELPNLTSDERVELSLLAQQIRDRVHPSLVGQVGEWLSPDYKAMVPWLVKAVQQLAAKVEALEAVQSEPKGG